MSVDDEIARGVQAHLRRSEAYWRARAEAAEKRWEALREWVALQEESTMHAPDDTYEEGRDAAFEAVTAKIRALEADEAADG